MEYLKYLERFIDFQSTSLVDIGLKGVLGYFALLWLAVVIWVARDVIDRTNSLIFQVSMITLNLFLPVFGLLIYLIIRPSKTLIEKYYEEMEYKVLAEGHVEQESSCPRCDESLKAEFIFCPTCQEKIKNTCYSCKHNFNTQFKICPYCGRKQRALKSNTPKEQKEEKKQKTKTNSISK
jgi:uncharacterized Zn finger protein (UPF0148 family)